MTRRRGPPKFGNVAAWCGMAVLAAALATGVTSLLTPSEQPPGEPTPNAPHRDTVEALPSGAAPVEPTSRDSPPAPLPLAAGPASTPPDTGAAGPDAPKDAAAHADGPGGEAAGTSDAAQNADPPAPSSATPVDDLTGTVEAAPAAEPAPLAPVPAGPVVGERTPEPLSGAALSGPDPQAEKLLARAETAIKSGNVTSARLWLQRASDLGDAKAVFRLAETYDPAVLRDWNVIGLMPDPARARELYHKALEMGEWRAQARLDALAVER